MTTWGACKADVGTVWASCGDEDQCPPESAVVPVGAGFVQEFPPTAIMTINFDGPLAPLGDDYTGMELTIGGVPEPITNGSVSASELTIAWASASGIANAVWSYTPCIGGALYEFGGVNEVSQSTVFGDSG